MDTVNKYPPKNDIKSVVYLPTKCPKCRKPLQHEFDSTDTHFFCVSCGYHAVAVPTRWNFYETE